MTRLLFSLAVTAIALFVIAGCGAPHTSPHSEPQSNLIREAPPRVEPQIQICTPGSEYIIGTEYLVVKSAQDIVFRRVDYFCLEGEYGMMDLVFPERQMQENTLSREPETCRSFKAPSTDPPPLLYMDDPQGDSSHPVIYSRIPIQAAMFRIYMEGNPCTKHKDETMAMIE